MQTKKKVVNVLTYEDRIVKEATLIADMGKTVRQVAALTGHCKSGVHRDCTDMLKELSIECPKYRKLYEDTQKVLKKNKDERHIRGGEATKRVMLKRRSKSAKAKKS